MHLGRTGFSPNGLTFTATFSGPGLDVTAPAVNIPTLSFSKYAQVVALGYNAPFYTNPVNETAITGEPRNSAKMHYLIANKTLGALMGNNVDPTFTPAAAYAIDQKMDDGFPLKGDVRGTLSDDGTAPSGPNTDCINDVSNIETAYDTEQTAPQCELSILMFSQTGAQ